MDVSINTEVVEVIVESSGNTVSVGAPQAEDVTIEILGVPGPRGQDGVADLSVSTTDDLVQGGNNLYLTEQNLEATMDLQDLTLLYEAVKT